MVPIHGMYWNDNERTNTEQRKAKQTIFEVGLLLKMLNSLTFEHNIIFLES